MASQTTVLIHGLSASKHSWDSWVARHQSRGYTVVAPPTILASTGRWPSSNNADDPLLSTITLPQVLAHLTTIIKSLGEKPILLGHSFGGLLTQILLQRDLAVVGVAIDGARPPAYRRSSGHSCASACRSSTR